MQDIKNRDFTSLISNKKNKIHYTQRNKIAKSKYLTVVFRRGAYHLLSFTKVWLFW